MNTVIEKISSDEINNLHIIETAAGIISSGGLVVFPTETVYGLGADCYNEKACAGIYEAKGRPSDNPLIVHISEIGDLFKISDNIPEKALKLVEKFWPGPLTVIVEKNDKIPPAVTGGLGTVAVRLPSNDTARRLISASGTFIAAPSANISGRPSPTRAAHVIEDLDGRVDMIIDGGDIEIGLESTIVDMTEEVPVILRPGYITADMIEEAVGSVSLDKALMTGIDGNVKPKAPGMKYRHYAPRAELTVISGENASVVSAINDMAEASLKQGLKVGVLVSEENFEKISCGEKISPGSAYNRIEIAKNLFACLRRFDEINVDIIYSEGFSEDGIGQAVMNRLRKAAGNRIIKV